MGKALTTKERARRQIAMVEFRSWMEDHGVSRQDAADFIGITVGHLSTLINANRISTEAQVNKARRMMGLPIQKPVKTVDDALSDTPRTTRKKRKGNDLRPLTKVEADFIKEVAAVWAKNNKKATQDQFVEVVRALSIGIRS